MYAQELIAYGEVCLAHFAWQSKITGTVIFKDVFFQVPQLNFSYGNPLLV